MSELAVGIRSRVLTPLTLWCIAVGSLLLLLPAGIRPGTATGLIGAVLLLVVLGVAAVIEWRLHRPLLELVRRQTSALAETGLPAASAASPSSGDELAALSALNDQLQQHQRENQTALAEARNHAQELQARLRDLEERYELAVERANDGSWDWYLRTGATDFSPRWKGMLHYSGVAFAHIDEWKQLIAPEDRDSALMRIENHLQGLTPHFDAEYRLRDGAGRYRWIHSRGIAVRSAGGSAYRLIVMDQDIHDRKELETLLVEAAEGLASVSGEDFFRALTSKLSTILGTRDNLVAYCIGDPPQRAHTLAYYSRGQQKDNFEFDLAGTSCEAVLRRGEIVYCPSGLSDIWPFEKQYDRDSYVGVPMFDSNGKIIGHFACMDNHPMRHDLPHLAVFRIFSVRAAIELERLLLKQQLQQARA